ncbi:MAG: MgtC/SapB family protein [Muribaculaceae bacterium]|nr:MgtC/SapB family protein [Muribaculaceae bacterium]
MEDIYNYVSYCLSTHEVTTVGSVFKLILSMLLGAVVGFERKRKGQTAGVRTFSLIAMGATLAMLLSIYIPQEYMGLKNGDPGRIAAQVISGVGFLGAGAIIQMKGSVRGLTTAAGIWMMATIGMAVGCGMYVVSVLATALIMFILVQLEHFEHRLSIGNESRIIRLRVNAIVDDISPYEEVLGNFKIRLKNYYIDYDYKADETKLNLVVLMGENIDYISLFGKLSKVHPTESVTLANQLGF